MRSVAELLSDHGNHLAGRRAARQEVIDEFVEEARHKARFGGLSGNCVEDTLAHTPFASHRCRNDGSGCLCECHDQRIGLKRP